MKKEILNAINDEREENSAGFSMVKKTGKGILIGIMAGIIIGFISEAALGFAVFIIVFLFYLIKLVVGLATINTRHDKKRKENINNIMNAAGKTVGKSIKQVIKE